MFTFSRGILSLILCPKFILRKQAAVYVSITTARLLV